MNRWKSATAVLLAAAALSAVSHRALSRKPVDLFLVKADARRAEAYRVRLYLNGDEPSVEVLDLDASHRGRLVRAVAEKDLKGLKGVGNELGEFRFSAAFRGLREGWPWYLGGPGDMDDDLGDLNWFDKRTLSFAAGSVPPPRFVETPAPDAGKKPIDIELGSEDWAQTGTPTPGAEPASAVRMEILNDCGITGAADGIARAMKRPGVEVVRVGNTKRFRYRRTHIQSSVGVPVVVKEILEEMGIPEKDVKEFQAGRRDADVVIVVGRDYKRILERMRDRARD